MPSITRKQSASREDRRNETIEAVTQAIGPLLDDGVRFTELSVAQIVKRAGISRTTFYVYFEDKGDLLVALSEGAMSAVNEAGRRWWTLPPDADREQLRTALRGVVDVYVAHRSVMKAIAEVAAYDDRVSATLDRARRENQAGLQAHIEQGLAERFIRPEIDARRTAAWLGSMAERGFNQLIVPAGDDEAELDRLTDALTTVVWNTLYAGARNGR